MCLSATNSFVQVWTVEDTSLDSLSEMEAACGGAPPIAGAEYSCDSRDCSTKGDRVLNIASKVNQRFDADMEVALALAIDMVEGKLTRRQAEQQTGR